MHNYLLVIFIILASTACSNKENSYFPLSSGLKWHYNVSLTTRDGLVHISQISEERVENVSDKLSEGDTVKVKVLEVDKQGRVRLSMKAIIE